jgi:hypothetical protein
MVKDLTPLAISAMVSSNAAPLGTSKQSL